MTLRVLVLLFLSLPPWWQDRQEENRSARIEVMARATEYATDRLTCNGQDEKCRPLWPLDQRDDLAILLATIAWHETRLAKHVHENRCRRWECDPYHAGGELLHSSRGPWQVKRAALPEHWDRIQGSDLESTKLGAYAAARLLSYGRRRCGGTLAGAVSMYATGRDCAWEGTAERMRTFRKLKRTARKLRRKD